MKKFIYYVITSITLCGITLTLCYCRNNNPITKKNSSTNASDGTQYGDITLTDVEQNQFNILNIAFDKTNEKVNNYTNQINNGILQMTIKGPRTIERIRNKYPGFSKWLSKNIPKQKELANAFASAYNFIEKKRGIYAPEKTVEQYISNAIDCSFDHSCNNKNNIKNYGFSDTDDNLTSTFFTHILINITVKDTNEEMFNVLKENLTNETIDSPLYLLKNWK
ncbi:Mlp family lipoprotein (plasmid) [Borrelia miyamotoi]|uniref:Mlp family lipoprotein n=1 Tax=Borrelia miyamotoi TaxID=47466 RepID=A0A5P8ARM4_9SPIR|nr:Mlp family lipoprotein [Borrelia miyamotoi]QFP42607.1 Mlp family lipoprotein [Borrelia miyamotoi]WAZ72451.1 Mlp family lipoprotein [Borrelia miyamotoi]WVI05374.1 Mlp family lipoprotein [Borrelia miyamotoi]